MEVTSFATHALRKTCISVSQIPQMIGARWPSQRCFSARELLGRHPSQGMVPPKAVRSLVLRWKKTQEWRRPVSSPGVVASGIMSPPHRGILNDLIPQPVESTRRSLTASQAHIPSLTTSYQCLAGRNIRNRVPYYSVLPLTG